jgi:hypothetical protein
MKIRTGSAIAPGYPCKGKGRALPLKTRTAHYPARLISAQKGTNMEPQESQDNQPSLFMDDESRLARLEGITAEAREDLADLFIVLRRGMRKEGCGWQVVEAELDRFIELLFRDSEAYHLALRLYAGRYEVIAARDAADILREVIAEHMPEDDAQPLSEK